MPIIINTNSTKLGLDPGEIVNLSSRILSMAGWTGLISAVRPSFCCQLCSLQAFFALIVVLGSFAVHTSAFAYRRAPVEIDLKGPSVPSG